MPETKRIEGNPFDELASLNCLIHDLHVRNKNQHRRSQWWKQFNIFRKQLKTLTTSEIINSTSFAMQSSEANERVSLKRNGEKRVEIWSKTFIECWHSAFMQLLSERRYASLGVVILAIFSRVCMLVGATDKLMEAGRHVLADEIQMHGIVTQALKPQEEVTETVAKDPHSSLETDELGEIVSRDYLAVEKGSTNFSQHVENKNTLATSLDEGLVSPAIEARSEPGRRKNKKSKDEIDDIFAAFGV